MKLLQTCLLSLFAAVALAAASPSGTVVVAGSSATITDSTGTVWGVNISAPCTATWAAADSVSEVTKNGALDPSTCLVKELAYVNGVVWQLNTVGNWYSWTGTAWSAAQTTSPLPPPPVVYSETLTWNAVTTNVDGSTPVSITYNVYEGPTATSLGATAVATGITALTSTQSFGGAGQTVCFAVSATNDQGAESAQSTVACKTFPNVKPVAPANLAVK